MMMMMHQGQQAANQVNEGDLRLGRSEVCVATAGESFQEEGAKTHDGGMEANQAVPQVLVWPVMD